MRPRLAPAAHATNNHPMHLRRDDLQGPEIRALLEEHLHSMRSLSPPGSVHALDLARLRAPDIGFWTLWDGPVLAACGALKELTPAHGELKSMRTAATHRGIGAGRRMLNHLIDEARSRRYARLSLETGAQPAFEPARQLYRSAGFVACAPFGDYVDDPHSVFMTLHL